MGNCKSVDRDPKVNRVIHILQFEHNFQELKAKRDGLGKCKDQLMQKVKDEEGPIWMKRREEVREWLESVPKKLEKADELISYGEKEIGEKNKSGGFRVKNQHCSHDLHRRIAVMKAQVDSLRQIGEQFEVLVERVFVEADHVRLLKHDIDALQSGRKELMSSKNGLMRRVKADTDAQGGEVKELEIVQVWFTKVHLLGIEIGKLLRDAPKEIEKCSVRGVSDSEFGQKVEAKLKDVSALISQADFDFSVVVERESEKPEDVESAESECVSQIEGDLESLRRESRELGGLKDSVKERILSEEGNSRKLLKHVDVWCTMAELILIVLDRLLQREAPGEINKLRLGDSSSKFGGWIEEMIKYTIDIIRRGNFSEVTAAERLEQAIEIDCGETVGLLGKLDEVWSVLMNSEVGILGLYGLGGVGKTTLLAHINNRFLHVHTDFDFVVWVYVSKEFNLSKLQDEIGERIGISLDDWKLKEIDEKAKEIHNVLRRRKFVLLLDDVRDKFHLERAGVPIPNCGNGCKVVFTTRSESVCSSMGAKVRIMVQRLPKDQAWKLFEQMVGKETISADPDILPVAQAITEECQGLPVAINVVARAMAFSRTVQEWRCALADLQLSTSDLQGVKDEVFARLKLSYDRLPNDKCRSCFLYCALFPEDFKIYKNDLVEYWISEKFECDEDGDHLSWAQAHCIIRDLVNACLLEEEGMYVKMHDVIRDMALWISCELDRKKFNFLVEAGKQLTEAPDVRKWEGVKRLSLMENSIRNLPEVSGSLDLRTLLLCHNPCLREINGSIFQYWPRLTVLDLSNTRLQELPSGITELFSLQYLNLSHTWIQQLPSELRRLTKLIYLNLEHNDFLGTIPKGVISSFLCLQVLKLFRSGFFYGGEEDNILSESKVLIEEVKHLKHLNVLTTTIRSCDALEFYFKTENVQSCTQSLSLECLGSRDSKSIDFSPTEVMDRLETLQISASEHLEQINLSTTFCFSNLREILVEYCPRLLNLNWIVGAPNLVIMKVAACEKLVDISDHDLTTFVKLEVLELEGLPQLESICYKDSSWPCLKRLKVLDCPLLKKLPLNLESLELRNIAIEAEDDWWKNLTWKDQATKDAFQ
ncbi:Disease resistance protein (CC-NBS-LRR class) family [Euphorbia peplus]|nr:Disease resistance protein (CC-NBS-LRR class) family [Euphorbia peplus]